jgi:hypothetical protein
MTYLKEPLTLLPSAGLSAGSWQCKIDACYINPGQLLTLPNTVACWLAWIHTGVSDGYAVVVIRVDLHGVAPQITNLLTPSRLMKSANRLGQSARQIGKDCHLFWNCDCL